MRQAEGQAAWQKLGTSKREAVQRMFAEIAPTYDRANALMSCFKHRAWRRIAVQEAHLSPGDKVLDVCCGTGDFLPILRKTVRTQGLVIGADFCLPMLQIADQKMQKDAELSLADACTLPFTSGQFDAVTVGWGLRNVPDLALAIREACRVLKPGGRFVSLDMARPRNPMTGTLSERMFHIFVPLLGRFLGHSEAYTYLPKSTEQIVSREELAALFKNAGFEQIKGRDMFFGNIHLICGVKA